MKIAFTSKNISPEIGGRIAGYGPDDFTTAKHDDLYLSALALNDGKNTCILLDYDLLGIDDKYIRSIRKKCAEIVGGEEAQIMLSCTHTHCGPHTRTLPKCDRLDTGYLEKLIDLTVGAVNELVNGEWFDTTVYWYALNCDENVNRRFIGNDNRCTFLPHRPDLEPLADGVRDRELGVIFFRDCESGEIRYVIGNYAAHPLAGHTPGAGGHRISADFPGVFRDYLKSELGCESMFLSGAAGDMVPKGHESGFAAAEKVGTELAMATIRAIISAGRAAAASHRMQDDSLRFETKHVTAAVRKCLDKMPPDHLGETEVELEIQLMSVGDVCLVGVPGELLAELGLEIKWHSPFRKTFILYCATGYF
ncbi:MAG: hypothetical protein J6Y54_03645, partial [Lentisphaeria bacterium]|nr:hypothetical protein [Lentisphaeria bacterium]